MDNKRKLLNFRPLFVLAICFIIGILLSSLRLRFNAEVVLFIVTLFIAFLLTLTIIAIYYKKTAFYVTLIISIILTIFSVFSVFNLKAEYDSENFNANAKFTGEIVKINEYAELTDKNYYSIVAKGDVNGKLNKVEFIVYTTYDLYVGNTVSFVADFHKNSYYGNDGKIYYNTLIEKEYYCALGVSDFRLTANSLSLINKLKKNILINVKKYMPNNYGFSYALLTGDTAYVNSKVLSGFSYTGVAHVFAVSGLHVGFLYVLITKLLKLLKLKRKPNKIITILLLFLYVYFCGFTPSCMRAFIILSVMALTEIIGAKGDRLSAVSLSAILILLFNPFNLFSVGFILSYVTYLSLILLTDSIEKGLSKILPTKVAKILAPSTSAFVGSTPIVITYFGYASAFAVLFNLIIVPIIGVVFSLNLIAVIGILISPIFSFLCVLPNLIFTALSVFITSIYYLAFLIEGLTFGRSIIIYYLVLLLSLKEINLSIKTRNLTLIIGWFMFILSFIVINIRNLP